MEMLHNYIIKKTISKKGNYYILHVLDDSADQYDYYVYDMKGTRVTSSGIHNASKDTSFIENALQSAGVTVLFLDLDCQYFLSCDNGVYSLKKTKYKTEYKVLNESRHLVKIEVFVSMGAFTFNFEGRAFVFRGNFEEFRRFLMAIKAKDNKEDPRSFRSETYARIATEIMDGTDSIIYAYSSDLYPVVNKKKESKNPLIIECGSRKKEELGGHLDNIKNFMIRSGCKDLSLSDDEIVLKNTKGEFIQMTTERGNYYISVDEVDFVAPTNKTKVIQSFGTKSVKFIYGNDEFEVRI